MKRLFLIALMCVCLVLTGCNPVVDNDDTMILYASFYPFYALTDGLMEKIPGSELHCLVQPQDGCLREYALSDWDIYILASSADGVIMGGRGLESFENTLFGLDESSIAISAVLYNLELYNQEEESVSDEDASHLTGANPHLYMSIDGAKLISESIAATLLSYDPDYSDQYTENLGKVLSELETLKTQTHEITGDISDRSVVLMNEALIYVAQDYDLNVVEWIDRESGEALYDSDLEECIETISAAKADAVLIEKQAPQSFKDALKEAGFKIAEIDILSTKTEVDGFQGYIDAQISNAQALKTALDG